MMRADRPQRPGQPGTGLFAQLPDDAVPDAFAGFAGAARQHPHAAVVLAHDDALAGEADHVDVGHQFVGRKFGGEGRVDAGPLPALPGVEQREAGRE
jgi:hypothetical protein